MSRRQSRRLFPFGTMVQDLTSVPVGIRIAPLNGDRFFLAVDVRGLWHGCEVSGEAAAIRSISRLTVSSVSCIMIAISSTGKPPSINRCNGAWMCSGIVFIIEPLHIRVPKFERRVTLGGLQLGSRAVAQ